MSEKRAWRDFLAFSSSYNETRAEAEAEPTCQPMHVSGRVLLSALLEKTYMCWAPDAPNRKPTWPIMACSVLLTLGQSLLPVLMRQLVQGLPGFGSTPAGSAFGSAAFLGTVVFGLPVFTFLNVGLMDMLRRFHTMRDMGLLIRATSGRPTPVPFLDMRIPENIRCWTECTLVLVNFGRWWLCGKLGGCAAQVVARQIVVRQVAVVAVAVAVAGIYGHGYGYDQLVVDGISLANFNCTCAGSCAHVHSTPAPRPPMAVFALLLLPTQPARPWTLRRALARASPLSNGSLTAL
jgi:hypothetical protein